MLMLRNLVSKLRTREEGVTMIEYALMAALIAVAVIGIVTTLGGDVGDTFTAVSDGLTGATTP